MREIPTKISRITYEAVDSQEMISVNIKKPVKSCGNLLLFFPEHQSHASSITDTSRKHNYTKDIEARKESRVDKLYDISCVAICLPHNNSFPFSVFRGTPEKDFCSCFVLLTHLLN